MLVTEHGVLDVSQGVHGPLRYSSVESSPESKRLGGWMALCMGFQVGM